MVCALLLLNCGGSRQWQWLGLGSESSLKPVNRVRLLLASVCVWGGGQDFLPTARRCDPVLLTVGVCGEQGKGSTQSSVFRIPAMCTLFLWCAESPAFTL